MGYIRRMKANVERKRREEQHVEALGRVVFHGKLKKMPETIKQPGCHYKHLRVHGRFGHGKDIVIEISRRARRT